MEPSIDISMLESQLPVIFSESKSSCTEPVDTNKLADYIKGCLSGKDLDKVEKHLSKCDACLEFFLVAHSLLKTDNVFEGEPVSGNEVQSIRKRFNLPSIVDWMSKALSPPLQPGLAIRGAYSDDYIHLSKNFGGLQTDIYIEESENDKISIEVKLLEDKKNAENAKLILINEDEDDRDSRYLTGDSVLFHDKPFGSYCFIVRQNAKERGNYFFTINEAGLYEK
ncbi:zf-HC2 domain-containing protein [Desulfococcaceae bacterium HSG8]|nr:zf-HC2 domain-containing protein [Desulfococcaceae bacterium HSG8]